MEFKSDVLNRSIVLRENKVCIQFNGFLNKLTGTSNIEFTYEQIKSIEVLDSKASMLNLKGPSIIFKVDGQEFKGRDAKNPYKVFFSEKQREQPKLIKDEIYKRIEDRKNQDKKGSSSQADNLNKFANLKEKGIVIEEEFNVKKKTTLSLLRKRYNYRY